MTWWVAMMNHCDLFIRCKLSHAKDTIYFFYFILLTAWLTGRLTQLVERSSGDREVRVQFPVSLGVRNGLAKCGKRALGRLPRSTGRLVGEQEPSRKWKYMIPCGGREKKNKFGARGTCFRALTMRWVYLTFAYIYFNNKYSNDKYI